MSIKTEKHLHLEDGHILTDDKFQDSTFLYLVKKIKYSAPSKINISIKYFLYFVKKYVKMVLENKNGG